MGNSHLNSGYLSAELVNSKEGGNLFGYSAATGEGSRLGAHPTARGGGTLGMCAHLLAAPLPRCLLPRSAKRL